MFAYEKHDSNRERIQSPSINMQQEFFDTSFRETVDYAPPRMVKGPFYSDFLEIMQETQAKIEAVSPSFTPDYIVPSAYRSDKAKEDLLGSFDVSVRMRSIGWDRLDRIDRLTRHKLVSVQQELGISPDLLADPPYCTQGDELDDKQARKACTMATFRMVFGGITDWVPSEEVVANSLKGRHESLVVTDAVYTNVYKSEAFKEICSKKVITLELIGTDFSHIDMLATKIKSSQPAAQVFCIVSLSSETEAKDIWHSNILLGTSSEHIMCHDPLTRKGAYRKIDRSEFSRRWAISYNRAQLIIAA